MLLISCNALIMGNFLCKQLESFEVLNAFIDYYCEYILSNLFTVSATDVHRYVLAV